MPLTTLKCTIQWHLVNPQCCVTTTSFQFQNFFITSEVMSHHTLYLLSNRLPFPHCPSFWQLLNCFLSLQILDISSKTGEVLCISLEFVINMNSFILSMKCLIISVTIQFHTNEEFEFVHHDLFWIFNVPSYFIRHYQLQDILLT